MKRSVIKELIKRSMQEVAPKKDSGVMTPEEEENAAADLATINRYKKEKKEMDVTNGPSVVPGAVPVKEGSDIPDDIEWEVADVLGSLDAYSAELAMQGYSPTTGKLYSASADGTAAGGGDWDWSFSDLYNIEEMPGDDDVLTEADRIVAAYAEKKTLKGEMHGGYLELLEMNPAFNQGVFLVKKGVEDGASLILTAWNEWKEGPMTEPYMVEEAKQDVLAYLSSIVGKHLSQKMK